MRLLKTVKNDVAATVFSNNTEHIDCSDDLTVDVTIDRANFDRWVVGTAVDSRTDYIVHLAEPRFMAKIYTDDPQWNNGRFKPRNNTGIFIYREGRVFYDILWYGETPTEHEMRTVFSKADEACKRYYASLGVTEQGGNCCTEW